MTSATATVATQRQPALRGQTVVIAGSAGIGFDNARRVRAERARVILAGRDPECLAGAARELDAAWSAAFDATDPDALQASFRDLRTPIDHLMVTAGAPHDGPALEMSPDHARRGFIGLAMVMLVGGDHGASTLSPPHVLPTAEAFNPPRRFR